MEFKIDSNCTYPSFLRHTFGLFQIGHVSAISLRTHTHTHAKNILAWIIRAAVDACHQHVVLLHTQVSLLAHLVVSLIVWHIPCMICLSVHYNIIYIYNRHSSPYSSVRVHIYFLLLLYSVPSLQFTSQDSGLPEVGGHPSLTSSEMIYIVMICYDFMTVIYDDVWYGKDLSVQGRFGWQSARNDQNLRIRRLENWAMPCFQFWKDTVHSAQDVRRQFQIHPISISIFLGTDFLRG